MNARLVSDTPGVVSYAPRDGRGLNADMASKEKPTGEDRRQQTRESIEKLLKERQEMLVCYEQVAGIQPYRGKEPDPKLLERFSQLLMDYIAVGHFGIYQRLTEGNERRRRVLEVAQKIYPNIAETTEKALDFNDAYDKADKSSPFDELTGRLSELGEVLANRIELEDRLISAMLQREGRN